MSPDLETGVKDVGEEAAEDCYDGCAAEDGADDEGEGGDECGVPDVEVGAEGAYARVEGERGWRLDIVVLDCSKAWS